MSEKEMPTTEAVREFDDNDSKAYELAFHVLPTVVEGEVPTVFEAVKEAIVKAGGELKEEEQPQRLDLAYEIIKYIEGKHRHFHSAYFGWVRFSVTPDKIAEIEEALEENLFILRYLVVRLTKQEEANPFYFHQALEEAQKSENIDEEDLSPETTEEDSDTEKSEEETETKTPEDDNLDSEEEVK